LVTVYILGLAIICQYANMLIFCGIKKIVIENINMKMITKTNIKAESMSWTESRIWSWYMSWIRSWNWAWSRSRICSWNE